MTAVRLRKDEALHLAAFLGRIVGWDERAAVRVQARGGVVGVFAPCPLDVLVFVALPLAAPVDDPIDTTVSAGRLRDVIGDVARSRRRPTSPCPTPSPGRRRWRSCRRPRRGRRGSAGWPATSRPRSTRPSLRSAPRCPPAARSTPSSSPRRPGTPRAGAVSRCARCTPPGCSASSPTPVPGSRPPPSAAGSGSSLPRARSSSAAPPGPAPLSPAPTRSAARDLHPRRRGAARTGTGLTVAALRASGRRRSAASGGWRRDRVRDTGTDPVTGEPIRSASHQRGPSSVGFASDVSVSSEAWQRRARGAGVVALVLATGLTVLGALPWRRRARDAAGASPRVSHVRDVGSADGPDDAEHARGRASSSVARAGGLAREEVARPSPCSRRSCATVVSGGRLWAASSMSSKPMTDRLPGTCRSAAATPSARTSLTAKTAVGRGRRRSSTGPRRPRPRWCWSRHRRSRPPRGSISDSQAGRRSPRPAGRTRDATRTTVFEGATGMSSGSADHPEAAVAEPQQVVGGERRRLRVVDADVGHPAQPRRPAGHERQAPGPARPGRPGRPPRSS